ncbi:MAG: hypothetical protein IJU23_06305, partial [Proteobacteria bacterium]|nr:hypothetical protein [Pseudomonadota bacterium]
MKKLSLVLVGLVCTSMVGCSVEGNCEYDHDNERNNYKCKNDNSYVCIESFWEERSCAGFNGCDNNTGRCKTQCSDLDEGKTLCNEGVIYECQKSTQSSEIQNNKYNYEELQKCPTKTCNSESTACAFDCSQCPDGCNKYGTGCAMCSTNKCENGSLRKCK